MKLRYIELDRASVAELSDWTAAEIEREREETLKELGITRQPNESYLLAWLRTILAENGCEDNPENRHLLAEVIREDRNALLFAWVLGGEERKAFGLENLPEPEIYRAQKAADRELMAAFARAPDSSYNQCCYQTNQRMQPVQTSGVRQRVRAGQVTQTALGLLVVTAGAWAAKGLAAPVGWHTADIPVLLVWLGLTAAGASLLLGLAARVAGESGPLHRLGLWVAIPAAVTGIGLHMHASRKLEADAAQRERSVLPLRVDADNAEEVGYIQQIKRVDHLWENRREIYWFVKIPATNKVYSCSWESGFAGFAKSDAVKLIHRKSDMETADYSGFIIELRGDQAGRSARVWALDIDDLQKLDINER